MKPEDKISYDEMMDNMQNYSPKYSPERKPLSKEELLRKRYLVIADYPLSMYNVNDIIQAEEAELCYTENEPALFELKEYPHLFRELNWDEERSTGDMPGFVKNKSDVFKVKKWEKDKSGWYFINDNPHVGIGLQAYKLQPATEAEYLEYIKTKA